MSKQDTIETIVINGREFIPKDQIDVNKMAFSPEGLKYCIVRTYSAGVFAGYVESRNGREVVLRKARRLWMWQGAASLSQLAMEGTSKPKECKFPCEVDRAELLEAIEILEATEKARLSIAEVKIWKE